MRWRSALALLGGLLVAASCGGGSGEQAEPLQVVQIAPGASVSAYQVDFEDAQTPLYDSTWGRLLINPSALETSSGIKGGWLNVATAYGWAVVNLPLPPAGEPPFAVYFDLGLQQAEPLNQITVSVLHSNQALASVEGEIGQPSAYPADAWVVEHRGLGPSGVFDPGRPPPSLTLSARASIPRTVNGWYQLTTNVQCAHNQCLTMAIANVLQYLENMGVVTIPHGHTIGLRGDDTLVGKLDDYSSRVVSTRGNGSGLRLEEGVDGTFEYYADEGLTGLLDHRLQDEGWASSMPSADYMNLGSTSQYDGGVPTFAWIHDRLGDGDGVVAGYSHSGGSGGHAVRITAAFRDDAGTEWIRYTHDALQSNSDPTDTLGLENVVVILADLDGDGTPNLGTRDRELHLVWAIGE